jgi:AraC family transcriptional regulator of adaptative response/methylated-DNA-[protein]-cysteine methyltransferase
MIQMTTEPTVRLSTPSSSSDSARWSRVAARDRSADGAFVYAVTSTGVFCRPSCPSRRPRPERVRFFDTPAEAAQAGFRACKRCRPEAAAAASPSPVARVAEYLQAHADEPVSLAALGRLARLSPAHLQRRFTAEVGLSPREFQAACRAERFRAALRQGSEVTAAIYEAGYGSPSRVYDGKPTGDGMSPAAYRRGGAGLAVGHTIVPCALGRLLVAATDRGVCAVRLGASDDGLVRELRREFPAARLDAAASPPPAWVAAIVARVDGAPRPADVPLDVHGTAFQWRVWRALQAIPRGQTRTYGEVAAAIGEPGAVRAVARACATNPVALVVPCHRVVPKAGGTGGYRWGTRRKQRLLDVERA